jgi:hypothetical protein
MDWLRDAFKRLGTWILIFTNLVPISMQATFECVKLGQGFFMQWDIDLHDEKTGNGVKV